MEVKVSVIVPTYKPQAYLWDCLQSLIHQSFQAFEVFLVLNGPRDPYFQDIQTFLFSHPQFPCRLLYCEQPGVSAARNMGMDHAGGEYLTFLDDDDFLSPTFLEEMYTVSSPTTIGLGYLYSFLDTEHAYASLPPQCDYSWTREYDRFVDKGVQSAFLPYRYFGGPCLKFFHRDIIGGRRFDTRFANLEDVLFCFLISDRFQTVAFTSRHAVYYRRMRNQSAAHARGVWKRMCNSFRACLEYTRIYFSHPRSYRFSFYLTRVLGGVKGALLTDR